MVKNLPTNAGDVGKIPDQGGSPYAAERLGLCTATVEPVLWSLGPAAAELICCNY